MMATLNSPSPSDLTTLATGKIQKVIHIPFYATLHCATTLLYTFYSLLAHNIQKYKMNTNIKKQPAAAFTYTDFI